jgi:HAD superfamily hydrolase (TIGR01509 family)
MQILSLFLFLCIMDTTGIKHLIFDLGGVILNLDYQKTTQAFEALGLVDFPLMYSQASQNGLFDDYEKGLRSTPNFINALLDYLPTGTTANQVVAAWNAMILDFPPENLALLQRLKADYRLFLLSNTNDIHIQAVNRALQKVSAEKSLHPYFEKVYFSCEVHLRKPDAAIFELVCHENGLEMSETLFIDDSEQHIIGARALGLHTHFLTKATRITDLFQD